MPPTRRRVNCGRVRPAPVSSTKEACLAPTSAPRWRALVPAVLPCAAAVARLLDEERFLVERLPGYAHYRHEVPYRLVPGVW